VRLPIVNSLEKQNPSQREAQQEQGQTRLAIWKCSVESLHTLRLADKGRIPDLP
jgi:hypothetical protein